MLAIVSMMFISDLPARYAPSIEVDIIICISGNLTNRKKPDTEVHISTK